MHDHAEDSFKYTFNIDHLLYEPGTKFGDTIDTCYVPIFRSKSANQNEWYFGSLFLSYFYVVLDQTPMTERGQDYI